MRAPRFEPRMLRVGARVDFLGDDELRRARVGMAVVGAFWERDYDPYPLFQMVRLHSATQGLVILNVSSHP